MIDHDFYGLITLESIMDQTSWLDVMVRQYLETALWCEEFDADFDIDDIDESSIKEAIEDCIKFADKYHDHLLQLHQQCKYDQGDAGHDLWLTRNGHGAGFWDRNLGCVGDEMTKDAGKLGEAYLIKGDNGSLYIE